MKRTPKIALGRLVMWNLTGKDFYETAVGKRRTAFVYKHGAVWRYEIRDNNDPMNTGHVETLTAKIASRALASGTRKVRRAIKKRG